jgi:hypothetical protein
VSYLAGLYLFVGALYSSYLLLQAGPPSYREPVSVKVVGWALVALIWPAMYMSRRNQR